MPYQRHKIDVGTSLNKDLRHNHVAVSTSRHERCCAILHDDKPQHNGTPSQVSLRTFFSPARFPVKREGASVGGSPYVHTLVDDSACGQQNLHNQHGTS